MKKRIILLFVVTVCVCVIYSCTKDDNSSVAPTLQGFSANKTTSMNYTYTGVVEQNGRLVFDDLDAFHIVLDSLERNDSIFFATNPEPDLVDANGNNILGENPVLDDFEDAFSNFTSYHRKIETDEINTMNAGNEYDTQPLTEDDILATVLNEDGELQIGTTIYKILNECQRLFIHNEDEAALQRFNNGTTNPIFEPNLVNHSVCFKIGKFENEHCIPYFSYYVSNTNGLNVSFYNNSIHGLGINPTLTWDFGDGNTYTSPNTWTVPDHTYAQAGTYTVCLRMTGDCVEQYCQNITVGNVSATCFANWTFEFSNAAFTNASFFNSSYSTSSSGLTYSWNFDDGNSTSTQQNPSHTFSTQGSYNVCLTVTDVNNQCSDTECQEIEVGLLDNGLCVCFPSRWQYDNVTIGDRRMKKTIGIESLPTIGISHVISKTRFRKRGTANLWWKKRADFIAAELSGQVYTSPSVQIIPTCGPKVSIEAFNPRYNRSKARAIWHRVPTGPIRIKEVGIVLGGHQLEDDGFTFPPEIFPLPNSCPF
ncbi:MAG: PKD domain-containing protein [Chitinophagales bacterium]